MQTKPKSIRAIRKMRKAEPKLIQGVKQTMFVRGNRTSNSVMALMKDLRGLRRSTSVMFSHKHDILPFENRTQLQKLCKKADTSLFMFGSHNKKRPNNIHKVLDMVEMGIVNMKSISQIINQAEVPLNVQPFIFFQGDLWQSDEQVKKLKGLINDFFLMNNRNEGVQIDKMLKVVVCWSVTQDKKLFLNVFQVTLDGGKKILEEQGDITIQQLGPNVQFALRRQSMADEETLKKATYVPKPKKKKENKNIKYDNVGDKRGKLYLDRQNLNALPFKKRKPINKDGKGNDRNKDRLNAQVKNDDEFAQ